MSTATIVTADEPEYRVGRVVRTLSRSGPWTITEVDGKFVKARPEGEAWNRNERWFTTAEIVTGRTERHAP